VPRRSIWASGDLGFSIFDVEFIKTSRELGNPVALALGGKETRDTKRVPSRLLKSIVISILLMNRKTIFVIDSLN
jgi:hypothetical protein